jgi:hypothetical protein
MQAWWAKIVVWSCVLLWAMSLRAAEASTPAYRDFKLYCTSTPSPADPSRIEASATLVNASDRPLEVSANLVAAESLGFAGSTFRARVEPRSQAAWSFTLHPRDGFAREILKGSIGFNGVEDRELLMAVQGADPAGFTDTRLEIIRERARVVATYIPRTRDAIARVAAAQSLLRQPRPPLITLASEGKSDCVISVDIAAIDPGETQAPGNFETWASAADRTESQRELIDAIADLRRAIKLKSNGGDLPVVIERSPADARPLWIRLTVDSASRLHPDSYVLRTQPRGVEITGASTDGLRNGIFGLLSDHLDCHWFQPSRLGEEIAVAADHSAVVGQVDEKVSPSFYSVSGMSWGNNPEWDRRNRCFVNRARMHFGHAWHTYINTTDYPPDKHPDLWARDRDGKVRTRGESWSRTNFCSTSPQAIEIVAQRINAHFDVDPSRIVASIDPNDYAPMCLCDRCLALDKSYGQTREDGRQVADRLLHYSRQVHDRLKPQHQDKFLGFLIYGHQMEMPVSAVPHAHQAGLICHFPPRYDHTRPWNDPTSAVNREFHRLIKGWGGMLRQFGYYDYYGHWSFFGPWGMVHKMREDLPAFHELGGTFVLCEAQPNFGIHGLNLYIAARLCWDVNADVDVLVDEFVTKYYGPAAEPMRQYWLTIERQFALTRPGRDAERAAEDPAFWVQLNVFLAKAEAATQGQDVAQRFRDRVKFNRDGFDLGMRMSAFAARYGNRRKLDAAQVEQAIAELRAGRASLDALKARYGDADPYWPPLIRSVFYPDVDKLIERLRTNGELR